MRQPNEIIINGRTLDVIISDHALWWQEPAGYETHQKADLSGADLSEAYLQRAYLQDANLRGAYLRGACLRDACLRDADLQRAYLQDADLRGACLRGACLRDACLRDADLQRAYLQDANLRGANLRGACLRDANLRGANLRGACLDYSCWPLWCGSKNVKVDNRIAAQLAAHFCVLDCDDPDYIKARDAIMEFAKTSHRAGDLGLLE